MVVCGTHTLARARCPPLAAASAGCMCSGTHQLVRATAHATCRHRSYDNFLEVHEQLKARSRKYPGLLKRKNHFHTTKDRQARHEHRRRVCALTNCNASQTHGHLNRTREASVARHCCRGRESTRAAPRCGERLGVGPTGSPRPIGRRRCRRGPATAPTRSGVVPTLHRRQPSGRPKTASSHARTCAASTGGVRQRGRRHPAAGGTVGRVPTPAGRHAVGEGGQGQRRRRRRRLDDALPQAAAAAPAGRPPPRRARATSDVAAAGR